MFLVCNQGFAISKHLENNSCVPEKKSVAGLTNFFLFIKWFYAGYQASEYAHGTMHSAYQSEPNPILKKEEFSFQWNPAHPKHPTNSSL